jgi:hypothetical protein
MGKTERLLEPPPGNLMFWLAWEPRCFPQPGERRGIFDKPFLDMIRTAMEMTPEERKRMKILLLLRERE